MSAKKLGWTQLVKAFANLAIVCFLTAGFVAAVGLLMGFFGDRGYLLDQCSHFKLQFLPVLLWSTVLCLGRARKLLPAFAVLTLLCTAALVQRYVPSPIPPASGRSTSLKIMTANMQSINSNKPEKTIALIESAQPDIISLQELGDFQAAAFEEKLKNYPHRHLLGSHGLSCEGVGIMSRFPILRSEVCQFGLNFPALATDVQTPGGVVTVIVAHPWPPSNEVMWRGQHVWVEGAIGIVKKTKNPVILAGDLNSTQWGTVFRDLMEGTGLIDTSQGYGIQPTWPAMFHYGIALDHVLVSSQFRTRSHILGPDIGSDHLPVIVELEHSQQLPTKSTAPDTGPCGRQSKPTRSVISARLP